ncbi:DUF1295 domain-containing protein [Williamsia deligens]|uniref:DUF1295 domain-containing protein n=1 Tax=Williamsia deligens TaxID=321325 RepID=A0ABW3GET6_9NOCA|nr:DUF1295 domain-containing protein [Williamsia deligens]MCP2196043.1 Steroid 5-alpha reductase family enzyme [Williamsia deligens]
MSRRASFVRVVAAYVLALAVAVLWLGLGPRTSSALWDAGIADVLATLVVFLASRVHHNSSFYDAYWSVVPPLLAVYWWWRSDAGIADAAAWATVVVVMIWAVRLTANWAIGFPGLHHEDWRYPMLRERAGRWGFAADLVAIHLIPTVQVFLGSIPLYLAVTRRPVDLPWLVVLAAIVTLAAIALEWAADHQMRRFVAVKEPGQAMDRGLWAWSRHPNYFGEFGFWLGLYLLGAAAAPADAWWSWIGAGAMLAMFLGASIPMMEERSLASRPTYAEVIERVPRFVPRPPRSAASR